MKYINIHITFNIQNIIMADFQIYSTDIIDDQVLDSKFTKWGANITPNISWQNVPVENTKDLVLLCYDPDALPIAKKVWLHWLVFNIDPSTTSLTDGKFTVGKNDFKNNTYDGAMPPPGTGVHHYHYKLFALDNKHEWDESKQYLYTEIMNMMKDHIIAETEIVGTFEKQKVLKKVD